MQLSAAVVSKKKEDEVQETHQRSQEHTWPARQLASKHCLIAASGSAPVIGGRDYAALSRQSVIQNMLHGERHHLSTPERLAHVQEVIPTAIA